MAGWQLLADQVVKGDAANTAGSSGSGASSGGESCTAGAGGTGARGSAAGVAGSGGRLHQLRTERSLGACSSMSEDGSPSMGAGVTPRPHQWLYKEYRLLEEIGSGGFGRVCKCVGPLYCSACETQLHRAWHSRACEQPSPFDRARRRSATS
jgi:hypothetical protein